MVCLISNILPQSLNTTPLQLQFTIFSHSVSRSRWLQPLHLPPPERRDRPRLGPDVCPLRNGHQCQGVHRQGHQPQQVLRLCFLWQRHLRVKCYPGHEWLSNGHQEAESAAQKAQGDESAVLAWEWWIVRAYLLPIPPSFSAGCLSGGHPFLWTAFFLSVHNMSGCSLPHTFCPLMSCGCGLGAWYAVKHLNLVLVLFVVVWMWN